MKQTVISTSAIPLVVQWSCSKCFNNNVAFSLLKQSYYASRKTPVFRTPKRSLSEIASTGSEEALDEKIDILFQEGNPRKYREAQLNCKCSRCKHKEPWSRFRCLKFQDFYLIIAFIIAVFGMIQALSGDGTNILLYASIAALSWYVFKFIYTAIVEFFIKRLPERSLPKIDIMSPQYARMVYPGLYRN